MFRPRMMMIAPPTRAIVSLLLAKTPPIALAESPIRIKMKVKPQMNARAWLSTRALAAAEVSTLRSSRLVPVRNER
jgi:hypothetical protein